VRHQIVGTATIARENAPSRAQQVIRTGDVLFGTTRPTLRRYAVIPPDFDGQICSTGFCVLRPDAGVVLTNYLFHLLGTEDFHEYIERNERGASYPAISDALVKRFRIPLPPLEVQREIVRVLDTFTELEAKLEAELEAELELRLRQYAHYRHALLTFGDHVPRKSLGEIATIGTGSHDTKDAIPEGAFVFYARGRDPLRLDSFDFDERAIITAGDGVGVGKVFHFADGKYALHQRAYRIVPTPEVDARYIYHYLVTDFARYLEMTSVHASVTSLRRPMFLKYPVAVPPLDEQERIVAILDKLDALVNDLSIGLPAELHARRQQYEHYRDRLLTFPETA
jgi:type I restriction enzyme, S subunit